LATRQKGGSVENEVRRENGRRKASRYGTKDREKVFSEGEEEGVILTGGPLNYDRGTKGGR